MKQCCRCKAFLDLQQFHLDRIKKDQRSSLCKACSKKRVRNYGDTREKDWKRIGIVGMTVTEYDQLMEQQGGRCSICRLEKQRIKRRLCVDHDHISGRIRGLLCYKCNSAIGLLNDDISLLNNAISYLLPPPEPMNEKIHIYRCPKNCSVSDHKDRCKRCGEWMLSAGMQTMEEVEKFNEELTRSAI